MSWRVGDWCWHIRHALPCRIVDRQDMWGETAYRVWLPTKDAVVRARAQDLAKLGSIQPTVEHILHTAAAAKLLDSLEDNLLLAPIQSSVVPLPHQLYLLLLSATPHQGKTDQFMRLMQLIDRDSFPDEGSVSRDRVRPFVIRTEKRNAIDADGQPLFKPRVTRLQPVAWQARHGAQQRLYEAVTDYVRHGYNQALAAKQRHIGFLMILMQRLVTSSTAAIRTTLEKRQARLNEPQPQMSLLDTSEMDEWAELDGQTQVDIAVQTSGWAQEKAEVDLLLILARETEAQGTDAKAEALLELIYKLQQEENDPAMKVLIFTEFVPTQAMLAGFLESRGFSVALLNGSMDLDTRAKAQQAFSREVRVLVSTDAGGEGLNLQFCHVIVNFDMPWNPMRIEQRIGRVDRIGQRHVVRAINFVLEDTVEHRVRQVLENKLEVIAQEFGVDKASDVMDSVDAEPIFDELFLQGLQDPASIEKACDVVIDQVREKVGFEVKNSELLTDAHTLDADAARKWRDHPAQFWLERAITTGLPARGGSALKSGDSWRVKWTDGSESSQVCFDARTAEQNPSLEWVTLEDPRARAVISELSRCVSGQPLPVIQISGLPESVHGVWSLWEISLSAESFKRKRFLPVFATDDGRTFVPTAKRIWNLLLTETIEIKGTTTAEQAVSWFDTSLAAAKTQGERLFADLLGEHRTGLKEERERAIYAFDARSKAIGRIGLPAVREHRRKRLNAEHQTRIALLDDAEASVPDLNAVLMIRVGPP